MLDMSEFGSETQMSSLEIAKLTGKRHDHVLRDIDNVLKTLSPDLGSGYKLSFYKDKLGRDTRMYQMDRDSTYCLVAGYDANARMRIIKRWSQLELQSARAQSNANALGHHLRNSTQIANSKAVNRFKVHEGGKSAAIVYNTKNCVLQSGRLPSEWKNEAKREGMPSRVSGSAKAVLRVKHPNIACGMSLSDQMVEGHVNEDDAIAIGIDSQPLFDRMLRAGFTPPELLC